MHNQNKQRDENYDQKRGNLLEDVVREEGGEGILRRSALVRRMAVADSLWPMMSLPAVRVAHGSQRA